MATFTVGGGGDFATITAALASGSVVPGDTLALLSGYNTEEALVGIENLTFAGDASNTGIVLTLDWGITAVNLTGSAPIAVTVDTYGDWSDRWITGNDGSNGLGGGAGNDSINGGAGADFLNGGPGNDSINGGAGADNIYYEVDTGYGIDTIDGGADHDTLGIFGAPAYFDDYGKGYDGNSWLEVVVVDGAITSIAGGTVANVESVMLDLGDGRLPPNHAGGGTERRRHAALRRYDGGRDREPCDRHGNRLHLDCGRGRRFRGLRQ